MDEAGHMKDRCEMKKTPRCEVDATQRDLTVRESRLPWAHCSALPRITIASRCLTTSWTSSLSVEGLRACLSAESSSEPLL